MRFVKMAMLLLLRLRCMAFGLRRATTRSNMDAYHRLVSTTRNLGSQVTVWYKSYRVEYCTDEGVLTTKNGSIMEGSFERLDAHQFGLRRDGLNQLALYNQSTPKPTHLQVGHEARLALKTGSAPCSQR